MEEEFKNVLAKKEITVDEYKGGSLEAKAKLVEAFEESKPKGSYSVIQSSCYYFIVLLLDDFMLSIYFDEIFTLFLLLFLIS
jgi:hypothetical protein